MRTLSIPYFDIYESQSYRLLEANGFKKLSEQVGMILPLTQPYEKADSILVEKVSDEQNALLWEHLFEQAFDYKINHQLLLPHYTGFRYGKGVIPKIGLYRAVRHEELLAHLAIRS